MQKTWMQSKPTAHIQLPASQTTQQDKNVPRWQMKKWNVAPYPSALSHSPHWNGTSRRVLLPSCLRWHLIQVLAPPMQTRADYTTVDQQSGRHEEPFHTAALWKRSCVPKKGTGAHNDPTQIGNTSLKYSHCASVMESQKMFQWKMSTCLEHCCPPQK